MTPGRNGRAVEHPGLEDAEHRKALLPPTTRTGGHGGKARQPKRGLATFYTNPKLRRPQTLGAAPKTLRTKVPKLITIKEAAAIAGVTTRTIERRLSAGSLRTYKTGHRTLVDESQVRDLFLTVKPA